MRTRLAALASLILAARGASASERPQPVVAQDLRHDLSPPLWLIRPKSASDVVESAHEPLPLPRRGVAKTAPGAVPYRPETTDPAGPMPLPLLSFDGVPNRNGVAPPDATGDVGPNHYVQWVNLSYAVWNKQGTLLYGPVNGNTIWSGFGGLC